jgi:hypothetical protein
MKIWMGEANEIHFQQYFPSFQRISVRESHHRSEEKWRRWKFRRQCFHRTENETCCVCGGSEGAFAAVQENRLQGRDDRDVHLLLVIVGREVQGGEVQGFRASQENFFDFFSLLVLFSLIRRIRCCLHLVASIDQTSLRLPSLTEHRAALRKYLSSFDMLDPVNSRNYRVLRWIFSIVYPSKIF